MTSLLKLYEKVISSEVNKTGGWRTFKPVYDQEKCIKCGTCWLVCPEGCVTRRDGVYEPNYDYCKGCGICANECPVGAIEMVLEEK
jgi:pyruvate ferredoxin oxidoreductase delta subunit